MKLDNLCNQIYVVALNEARMQAHEYLTPEHFLIATLMFDVGKEIIEKSGGNIKEIKDDLMVFLEENIPKKTAENPIDSFLFIRMFELATAQAHADGKATISIGNILSSMLGLSDCFATYFMQKSGVDKLKLIKLSRQEAKPQTAEEEKEKAQAKATESEFLKTYTVNLTEKAKQNALDPIIGREDVLNRTIQVLCRRLKNNPVHVGEPGVGKTAVAHGLAQRIVEGAVPKQLLNSQIFYIDMGTVLAGTKYRGDFEERLLKLLEIVKKQSKPIIYIDELHTVVGAGSVSGGAMDATGILKPFLASGEIKFIGTTTYDDYKKHLEKDKALSRRFQKIDVKEPELSECVEILKGVKHKYEEFHNVIYTDEIIKLTCELSQKYVRERFLPDKAIDVLDEAGAYARMTDKNDYKRVIVKKDIERTVAKMANLPENTVSGDEAEKLSKLSEKMKQVVFGQDEAIDLVVDAVKASRAGLNDTEKPVASLLFVGPTGVGKTEVAKQLSNLLAVKLIRFDMSEYQEKHSVARLIGSPPGYVGYEEGGLLTDQINKTPRAVLLLDEIEKAHADIYNVLLQIMDYGSLTDNTGKKADFRNIIIIMTSNAGAKDIGKRIVGFQEKRNTHSVVNKEVERIFSPEFRNRLDGTVVFAHINEQMAESIAKKAVGALAERLAAKNITVKATDDAIKYIAEKGISEEFGAREIIRVVETEIKKKLVDEVLFGRLKDGGAASVYCRHGKLMIRYGGQKKKSSQTKELYTILQEV